jgi:hypothetical protein
MFQKTLVNNEALVKKKYWSTLDFKGFARKALLFLSGGYKRQGTVFVDRPIPTGLRSLISSCARNAPWLAVVRFTLCNS